MENKANQRRKEQIEKGGLQVSPTFVPRPSHVLVEDNKPKLSRQVKRQLQRLKNKQDKKLGKITK